MAAFKTTEWKYSNEIDQTQIPIEEGQAYLFIRDARFDDDKGIYRLDVENLNTSAQFTLYYYLESRDENNQVSVNAQAKGTLISLGIALAGVQIGIPNPQDVKGGVVSAYINLRERQNGGMYPKVYHFEPVNEDMAAFATIDQYYTGCETEEDETEGSE
jgi:hypothetical protein